jgi:hypothetical protein
MLGGVKPKVAPVALPHVPVVAEKPVEVPLETKEASESIKPIADIDSSKLSSFQKMLSASKPLLGPQIKSQTPLQSTAEIKPMTKEVHQPIKVDSFSSMNGDLFPK